MDMQFYHTKFYDDKKGSIRCKYCNSRDRGAWSCQAHLRFMIRFHELMHEIINKTVDVVDLDESGYFKATYIKSMSH